MVKGSYDSTILDFERIENEKIAEMTEHFKKFRELLVRYYSPGVGIMSLYDLRKLITLIENDLRLAKLPLYRGIDNDCRDELNRRREAFIQVS